VRHFHALAAAFAIGCGTSTASDAGLDATTDTGPATDSVVPMESAVPMDVVPGPDVTPIVGCPSPTDPVAEPYRWFPRLDLARIPFHVAAGPWGARMPITAPAPPVVTRRITVATGADLAREALVPGSEITVTASIATQVVLFGNVTDLDLVVPPGVTLQSVIVGRAVPGSVNRRVRIRGSTPGMHSGGVIGTITFFSDAADLIIDGVDLNGADGAMNGLAWYLATTNGARVAIVNVRAHASASISLNGDVTDLVVAGSNLVSGARSRADNGIPEGWGLRAGRRIVVFGNRIEGNRYHRVRVHPGADPTEYAWLADNIFVDPHEARIASAFALPSSTTPWDGFWAECNTIYAYSNPMTGCLGHSFEAPAATYARLTNNTHFGTITVDAQRARVAMSMGSHDYTTDNTYAPWRAPPAWGPPGDPRQIPLPRPATVGLQDPMCPGPP